MPEGITIRRLDVHLSVGIEEPICGWGWLLGRTHPEQDCTISITGWGVRSVATFRSSQDSRTMHAYMGAAVQRARR